MRRFSVLLAAAVAAFGLTATGTAAAKPTPLFSTAGGYTCEAGALDASGATFGAASVRVHRTGEVTTVRVRLRGATPNVTYDVSLGERLPSFCREIASHVPLDTNDRGNGSMRAEVGTDPTATGYNVLVQGLSDGYATAEITTF
jgi:hypothetical protein